VRKLIIFDIDGTLTRTFHSEDETYLVAARRFIDFPEGYQYNQECQHLTDSGVFDFLFRKFSMRAPRADEIRAMQKHYLECLKVRQQKSPETFEEIPGAVSLMKSLMADDRYILGIATGNWLEIARFKLNLIGIDHRRIALMGADHHHSKDEFLEELIDDLGHHHEWDEKQAWYVGDSFKDFIAAQSNDLHFLGVDFLRTGKLGRLGVRTIIEDFRKAELPWH